MKTFGYTNGGEDDTDWGCVYRSVQNVMYYVGARVLKVETLVRKIGRHWGDWSEPADFVDMFPKRFKTRALLIGKSKDWLKLTSRSQYIRDKHFTFQPHSAYVIDDGISGYAIVPYRNKLWFIDPHTPKPVAVPFTNQLRDSSGWMILEVTPMQVCPSG